jgi:hypothetical protein
MKRKLGNEGHQTSISSGAMIAGNPKSCRTWAALAVALILLIMVSTAFIASRKKTAPFKALPLRPSTLVLSYR